MSNLRDDLALLCRTRYHQELIWKDGRLPEVDVQASWRHAAHQPSQVTPLGELWFVPPFCNFRFSDEQLWRAVEHWAGEEGDGPPDLRRRVAQLKLLMERLGPESSPPLPLGQGERRLAVALERLWSAPCGPRASRLLCQGEQEFHRLYERLRVSQRQSLSGLYWMGRLSWGQQE